MYRSLLGSASRGLQLFHGLSLHYNCGSRPAAIGDCLAFYGTWVHEHMSLSFPVLPVGPIVLWNRDAQGIPSSSNPQNSKVESQEYEAGPHTSRWGVPFN